ncbi:MAG: DUF6297 family protein [Solirubrobacterales bacterium]
MASAQGSVEVGGLAALRALRRTRRQRYVERIDTMELLYRIYVGAIFAAIGLGLLGGAINEAPATPEAAAWLRENGPALVGAAVSLGLLLGLRTGSRGGPLAIEPAEVQYVLLAPVERGAALRPAALRQMRPAAIAGAALGAVLGSFVFRRLPGSPVEWIACLALFGALAPLCFLAAAQLASGRRMTPLLAGAAGLALLVWSGLDLALGSTTSPATMLGELATLPVQSGAAVVLAGSGVLLAAALVGVGLLGVGGILLEAARRRAALAAELRFSASVQDLRTVVLLRRQLASERPRRRPWLRLPAGWGARHPVWYRGWQSFLRWPPARIVRVGLLGVAAGVLATAAWSGAAPALVLPGVLLFVAALDLVEPLAQESDHPTRRQLLPLRPATLLTRHLAAPAAALAGVVLLAAVAAALAGGGATALGVGLVACFPVALGLACCAAFSATRDPYANLLASPELTYAAAFAPLLAASLLVAAPLLVARGAERHGSAAVPAALGVSAAVGFAAAAAASALGTRFARRDEASR